MVSNERYQEYDGNTHQTFPDGREGSQVFPPKQKSEMSKQLEVTQENKERLFTAINQLQDKLNPILKEKVEIVAKDEAKDESGLTILTHSIRQIGWDFRNAEVKILDLIDMIDL